MGLLPWANSAGLVPAAPAEGELDEMGLPGEEYWRRMFSENSRRSADRLAAVFGCVQVISSSIAAMPLQLFRKQGKIRERVEDHPVARLLGLRPNEAMTWPQARESIMYGTVLRGNRYARVFWRNGYPVEVFPLPCGAVTPKLTDARRVVYEVAQNECKVPPGTFARPELAHFKGLSDDGLYGISPIEHCRVTMGSALALSDYGLTTAQRGGPINGVITMESAFKNAEQAKEVRSRWGKNFEAARRGDGVAIFEGGKAQFQPITMTMRDAQFLESMNFSVEEVCRIFNVPPHKVQKLDRATFNNIEHLDLEFYKSCLVPWIVRMEAVLNDCLLTDGDRASGLYIRHNADALLRGDLASRAEAQSKQIGSGVLTVNEARAMEDRPPVEGGDEAFFPINHTLVKKVGEDPPEAGTSDAERPTSKEEKE